MAVPQPGLDARLCPRWPHRHRSGAGRADQSPGRAAQRAHQAVLPACRGGLPRWQGTGGGRSARRRGCPAGAAYRHSCQERRTGGQPDRVPLLHQVRCGVYGPCRPRGARAQRGQQCAGGGLHGHHRHARHPPPPGWHDPHQHRSAQRRQRPQRDPGPRPPAGGDPRCEP
ncbi:hypothetical protein D3C79_785350 [compost metagenome]